MRFLKNKVVKTVVNANNTSVNNLNKVVKLAITDKITQYTPLLSKEVANQLNTSVHTSFEVNDLSLNTPLLQQFAKHSFQMVLDESNYHDLVHNIVEIKRLLKSARLTDNEDLVLNAQINDLINKSSKQIISYQKYLEKTKEEYPIRSNITPLLFNAHLPDKVVVTNNLEQNDIENTEHDFDPKVLENKELVFNGYVIKSNQMLQLLKRKQVEVDKVENFDQEVSQLEK